MEREKTLTLNQPVTVDGKDYTEVHLREPTVNEMIVSMRVMGNKGMPSADYDSQVVLVSKVSGLPMSVLDALPTRILDQAIEYLISFQNSVLEEEVINDWWDMPLDPPLTMGGNGQVDADLIGELTLKEPTVKQRKLAMKQLDVFGQNIVGGYEFQVSLLTQVTGQKMAVILKLPISQFMKASNYLMRFFPDGQKTGETLAVN